MIKSHQVALTANDDGTWTATGLADPTAAVTGPLHDLLSHRVELLIAAATGDSLPLDKPVEYRNRSGRLLVCTIKSAEPTPPPDGSTFLQLSAPSLWGEQMWSWLVKRAASDDGLRSIVHLHAPDLDGIGNCVTCQRRSPCPTQYNLVRHYLHQISK